MGTVWSLIKIHGEADIKSLLPIVLRGGTREVEVQAPHTAGVDDIVHHRLDRAGMSMTDIMGIEKANTKKGVGGDKAGMCVSIVRTRYCAGRSEVSIGISCDTPAFQASSFSYTILESGLSSLHLSSDNYQSMLQGQLLNAELGLIEAVELRASTSTSPSVTETRTNVRK